MFGHGPLRLTTDPIKYLQSSVPRRKTPDLFIRPVKPFATEASVFLRAKCLAEVTNISSNCGAWTRVERLPDHD
jgi:hypothetical protein